MKILTFGVFDYFHYGHLKLFEQAKEYGDYLIVAVQNGDKINEFKPEAKVLYSTEQRVEMIRSLRIVDEVITYDAVDKDIQHISFDILALGEDHTGERFVRAAAFCEANGKSVVRLHRTPGVSSSDIKKNINI